MKREGGLIGRTGVLMGKLTTEMLCAILLVSADTVVTVLMFTTTSAAGRMAWTRLTAERAAERAKSLNCILNDLRGRII